MIDDGLKVGGCRRRRRCGVGEVGGGLDGRRKMGVKVSGVSIDEGEEKKAKERDVVIMIGSSR